MTVMHRTTREEAITRPGWMALLGSVPFRGTAPAHRVRIYEPGQNLYAQGEACQGIYCIQSGIVGVRRLDEDGKAALLRLQRTGDVLGYPALISQSPHTHTVEALTTCRATFVDASHINWLIEHDTDLRNAFLQIALAELAGMEAKCAALLTVGMRPRLMELLSDLCAAQGDDGNGELVVQLPLQRKEIAALIGATPESLSRLINRLGEEGLVSFEGRRVTISRAAYEHGFRAPRVASSPRSQAGALHETLMEARHALLAMLEASRQADREALHAKVLAASSRLDALIALTFVSDAEAAQGFKAIWAEFKSTRQKEIIPAVYAGRIEQARKLADGVQAERLTRMRSCLGGRLS